ncbi:GntR family transcriptional regulator [Streptomyces sp. ID05-04B]|uniref:winged helix-turn-helix domain-containing protein n=1 Tax=Streptomyces sp. ID05-04B TaxID=3028661 RepID=UPI0029C120DF|nr:GntR family transcriptional regulator [Streptomyces sp. ID05-04B]MDX5569222.1 GntR family transcriptional regulator [Streptomyces sp. ID05-04B]
MHVCQVLQHTAGTREHERLLRQLAEILRAQIRRGDWQPGRMLPSEAQLVQRYGIERTTVRRGLGLLADESWVYAVPQRGWFVADPLPPAPEAPAS